MQGNNDLSRHSNTMVFGASAPSLPRPDYSLQVVVVVTVFRAPTGSPDLEGHAAKRAPA